MFQNSCYLCSQPIPEKQSFYEDHGVKVCLECYKDAARCKKCRFPSHQLKMYPGIGHICEFCEERLVKDSGMQCYLCQQPIPTWASFYSDYEKNVCQECFKYAKRCFLCRFPNSVEYVKGLGDVCEFCNDIVLRKGSNLVSFFPPLTTFLESFQYQVGEDPLFQWVDWQIVLGMQLQSVSPPKKIKFLDEYLLFCYPLLYFRNKFYIIPRINHQLFMVYLSGQFVAQNICIQFGQDHLIGNNPFLSLARGWVHWVSYRTAEQLRYTKIKKILSRSPESEDVVGDFSKFLAMTEYRENSEIVSFAHDHLQDYASRYL